MNYDRQFTSFCAIFAPYLKDVSPKQGYDAICAFFGYVTTGEEQENGLKGAALLLYHVMRNSVCEPSQLSLIRSEAGKKGAEKRAVMRSVKAQETSDTSTDKSSVSYDTTSETTREAGVTVTDESSLSYDTTSETAREAGVTVNDNSPTVVTAREAHKTPAEKPETAAETGAGVSVDNQSKSPEMTPNPPFLRVINLTDKKHDPIVPTYKTPGMEQRNYLLKQAELDAYEFEYLPSYEDYLKFFPAESYFREGVGIIHSAKETMDHHKQYGWEFEQLWNEFPKEYRQGTEATFRHYLSARRNISFADVMKAVKNYAEAIKADKKRAVSADRWFSGHYFLEYKYYSTQDDTKKDNKAQTAEFAAQDETKKDISKVPDWVREAEKADEVIYDESSSIKPLTNPCILPPSESGAINYAAEFENLWEIYPKEGLQKKYECFEEYKAARERGIRQETILIGAGNYSCYVMVNDVKPKFVKRLINWLKEEKWSETIESLNAKYHAPDPLEKYFL